MLDDHAHVMQVKLCKANTRGVTVVQPCSRRISQEQWKVADNEIVTICSTSLVIKLIILEAQSGVCFPRVFWDVGRRSVPRWEDGVEDVSAKGLRSRQVRARASVLAAIVASATMRVVAVACPLPRITAGTSTGVEGIARVMMKAEMLMHQDRDAWPATLSCLVD